MFFLLTILFIQVNHAYSPSGDAGSSQADGGRLFGKYYQFLNRPLCRVEDVCDICVKFLSDRLPQVPPDGHEKTLEAITIAGEVKGRDRFQPIVQVESQTSFVKKFKLIDGT